MRDSVLRFPSRLGRKIPWIVTAAALVFLVLPGVASAVAPAHAVSTSLQASATAGVVFLNISATETLAFTPSTVNVAPGQSVHLVVTQLADFYHSFTLSPLPNFTFSSSATAANVTQFFAAHPPLVDMNLSQTKGSRHYANFTAPGVGSYEFLCTAYGATHFQQGMFGTLVSSSASTSSPSTSPSWLIPVLVVIIVVVIVAVIAGVVMMRRKPKAPTPAPPGATEPPAPPMG